MKRLVDLTIAVPALLLLAPILLFVAIGVRLKMGRPILFRQVRPGIDGRPFQLLKFRSMHNVRDCDGGLREDGERLTNFGRLLRSSSLDELPSLWNVLKGDMSLVGPRPLLMDYVVLYTPEQARRMEVRPGITGWAQINGRNAISWADRFQLDTWYVDHWSLALDLKILWLTIGKVFRRKDISAEGEQTMTRFTGSDEE